MCSSHSSAAAIAVLRQPLPDTSHADKYAPHEAPFCVAQGVAPFGQDIALLTQVHRSAGGQQLAEDEAAALPRDRESFPEVHDSALSKGLSTLLPKEFVPLHPESHKINISYHLS